jgi:hypothetical protein
LQWLDWQRNWKLRKKKKRREINTKNDEQNPSRNAYKPSGPYWKDKKAGESSSSQKPEEANKRRKERSSTDLGAESTDVFFGSVYVVQKKEMKETRMA